MSVVKVVGKSSEGLAYKKFSLTPNANANAYQEPSREQPTQQIVLILQRRFVDLTSKTDHSSCLFSAFGSIVCQNEQN